MGEKTGVWQMDKDGTGLTGNGARDYQQRRYRSLDQAWVNWREQRIMARLLRHCQLASGTLLDVPCGYGRFAPLFAHLGITAVGADANSDMVHLAIENHAAYGRGGWLRANIFHLPFAENTFDGALCIRLLHHRYSDAERQRILCELARVSRRFVLISFYRFTPVHTLARHWRGTRGRLAMTTLLRLRELAQASGLQIQHVRSLMRFCHAQTFVILTKNPPARQALQPVYLKAL
jgi:ubiquinone/menaquinone biosynthesis C-methylase UbiE